MSDSITVRTMQHLYNEYMRLQHFASPLESLGHLPVPVPAPRSIVKTLTSLTSAYSHRPQPRQWLYDTIIEACAQPAPQRHALAANIGARHRR